MQLPALPDHNPLLPQHFFHQPPTTCVRNSETWAPETRERQQEGLTLLSSTTSKLNPPLQPLTCNTAKEFTTNNTMLFLTFLPLQRYWRNKLSISLNTFHHLRYLRIDFWERNTAMYLIHVVHIYFIWPPVSIRNLSGVDLFLDGHLSMGKHIECKRAPVLCGLPMISMSWGKTEFNHFMAMY